MLRPNFIVGPTANVAVRRAMLAALSQTDAMTDPLTRTIYAVAG